MDGGFAFAFGGEDIQDPSRKESPSHFLQHEDDNQGPKADDRSVGRPARSHDLQEIVSGSVYANFESSSRS